MAVMSIAACGSSVPSQAPPGASPQPTPGQVAECGDYAPTRNAYFGDLHVHTANSFDAYLFGNHMNNPEVAYDFAQGRQIQLNDNTAGQRFVQLRRPLDFAAVTDHSEYLGEVRICTDAEQGGLGYYDPLCAEFRVNRPQDNLAFLVWGVPLTQDDPSRLPMCTYADCATAARSVWEETSRITDSRNQPCRFTAFNAYEYSPSTAGSRLHRNIVFRSSAVPEVPVSYFEAPEPIELFNQLNAACDAEEGCEYLSIPHNSNLSHGRLLWADPERFSDPQYVADLREIAQVNPVLEMMQIKGNSECKLGLGTTDEECEFEQLRDKPLCCDPANGITENCTEKLPSLPFVDEVSCHEVCPNDRPDYDTRSPDNSTGCVATHDFVRGAFLKGMQAQQQLGFNPLRFSLIASTDNHNAASGDVDEQGNPGAPYGWEGGHGGQDDDPEERLDVLTNIGRITNPGGLAGVWADQNTRESLYASLRRGEVFATSGTRMRVRLFAGDYPADLCALPDAQMKALAYQRGVPMGADARLTADGGAPAFALQVMADEQPLQRLQIVKLSVDTAGDAHEKVYDLATFAPVADVDDDCTIHYKAATETRMSACMLWHDPDFDSTQTASYYLRAFEDASCRWTGHMCAALRRTGDVDCAATPDHACCPTSSSPVKAVVQERAWSSPIWYTPESGS
jgi:hypothetical protein